MQLDFEEIKKLIPQRFPFIMIDRIVELEPGKHVVAIKNVTGNDILFLGHFPEKAVFPGAALLEAMAQAAIVLFASESVGAKPEQRPLYYFGSVKARFLAPVVPGDQIRISVSSDKILSSGAYVSSVASVNNNKIAEAELVFSVKAS